MVMVVFVVVMMLLSFGGPAVGCEKRDGRVRPRARARTCVCVFVCAGPF